MSYRVNEIFLSLQGEGFWTGTPMVFLRFSGCNLACPFCDTSHREYKELSVSGIVEEVLEAAGDCRRVCITGGEPALQLDRDLIESLHSAGFKLHLETNGTQAIPEGLDWITVSPKEGFVSGAKVVLNRADELKLVFDQKVDPSPWAGFPATWHFLQPCDTGDREKNAGIVASAVEYILRHPVWRLSVQAHKFLGIR